MKTFVCQMCGKEFESTANRASYCQDCRVERQKERSRIYTAKIKNNETTRTIGATDICPECGNAYIIKSGSQKVCENCRRKHNNKIKQKPNARYTASAYDQLSIFVKKGEKDKLKEIAQKHNMSLNELVNFGISLAVKEFEST